MVDTDQAAEEMEMGWAFDLDQTAATKHLQKLLTDCESQKDLQDACIHDFITTPDIIEWNDACRRVSLICGRIGLILATVTK
ncbi:MAG: hypothetical protein WC845_01410 [Candidatus Staskawiczbacteria bacterium]